MDKDESDLDFYGEFEEETRAGGEGRGVRGEEEDSSSIEYSTKKDISLQKKKRKEKRFSNF